MALSYSTTSSFSVPLSLHRTLRHHTMSDLAVAPPPFLVEHVEKATTATSTARRPHITLTWAQSLDMKIAGPGGARVTLSGPESMLMTHW